MTIAVVAGAMDQFPYQYRARAVVRPFASLGASDSMQPGSETTSDDANRLISILQSRTFLQSFLQTHPASETGLITNSHWLRWKSSEWAALDRLRAVLAAHADRFGEVEIDLRLPNRLAAQKDLGWLIDDLRTDLRRSTATDYDAQARSLEDQARRNSDPQTRAGLDRDVARAEHNAALIKVQPNFGFVVVDPPIAEEQSGVLRWPIFAAISLFLTALLLNAAGRINERSQAGAAAALTAIDPARLRAKRIGAPERRFGSLPN